jgi:hypothetical protein
MSKCRRMRNQSWNRGWLFVIIIVLGKIMVKIRSHNIFVIQKVKSQRFFRKIYN